jgi:hypothetical protein
MFLRERSLVEQDSILSSFTESLRRKGLDVEMRVLSARRVHPKLSVRRALETSEGRVWWVQRLAIVESEPAALLTSFPSLQRYPDMPSRLGTRGSLYRVLEEDFGVIPTYADATVEVAPCPTLQSPLLEVPSGSSVLVSWARPTTSTTSRWSTTAAPTAVTGSASVWPLTGTRRVSFPTRGKTSRDRRRIVMLRTTASARLGRSSLVRAAERCGDHD